MNLNDIITGKATNLKISDNNSVMNKFKLPVKEQTGSGFISGDNIVVKTLKKVNESGSNPFGAGVNTAKKPADESTAQGIVARNFISMKSKLDLNNDGFISKKELVERMGDKNIKGQEAALVGTLLKNESKVKNLSNDETALELKGITTKDILALDKLPFENKLRGNVDNGFYNNISKINNAGNYKENGDKLKLPEKASDIDYKDLQQGSAGDCYFMAALASLAQRNPQKIVDMIQDNKNGTYTVKFPSKPVTINAPTDTELGLYGEGKAWVPIMEKAYGELRNDKFIIPKVNPYDLIGGGSTIVGRAIQELTGNPRDTDFLFATTKDFTRERLKHAVENNKLMVASINKSLFGKNELNLPDGHVYTILDYDPKTDKVKLRNPWGSTEAQNKDGSTRDGTDDGIFEVTLDEFDKIFSTASYER